MSQACAETVDGDNSTPLPRGDFRQHQEQVLQAACLHIKVASPDYLSCGTLSFSWGRVTDGGGMVTPDSMVQPGKVNWKGESLHPLCCLLSLKCSAGVEKLEFPSPNKQDNPNPVASRSQGFPCPEVPKQVLFSSVLTVFTLRSRGWWLRH